MERDSAISATLQAVEKFTKLVEKVGKSADRDSFVATVVVDSKTSTITDIIPLIFRTPDGTEHLVNQTLCYKDNAWAQTINVPAMTAEREMRMLDNTGPLGGMVWT